jgi:hypothetical protein
MKNKIKIRNLIKSYSAVISEAFHQIGWNKPVSFFEGYLKAQEANERIIWVTHFKGEFAGYVTLKWRLQYQFFQEQSIPEIMDLNVLPVYRKMGCFIVA